MGQNSGLLSSLTDWNSTLAGYADSISTGVVMPVALTLLALFMILELYNATQRIAMNGSNNAFTIQQIALVMLKIVVCRWAVVHTTEILNALFEIASTVTTGISGYVGSGEVNTTVDIENAIAALPGGIGNMPVALELMVVGWMLRIVNIVVNTIVAARFIELYVYNAMASLSIATLCYQELHGIAVNFLKSYLAVTQHVRSVLNNEDARRMLSDCGYIKLLNQAPDDANDIARLLHISDEEKRYIENAEVGSGLLIADKVVVPFNNTFPQDTELFRLMDTNPNRKK